MELRRKEGGPRGTFSREEGDPLSVQTSLTRAEMTDAPKERKEETERWRRQEGKQRGEPGK